jgi:transposase-like protein
MRFSKFSEDAKRSIIEEQLNNKITVAEICSKYKISINTFYIWKRKLDGERKIDKIVEQSALEDENHIITENKTLRKLYINLSAHNYELAKFLEK